MMHVFSPQSKAILPRELYALKRQLGGTAGEIRVGGQKLAVLKLGTNVYVSVDKPSHSLETAVNLDQADIHQIKNGADALHFSDRWKAHAA